MCFHDPDFRQFLVGVFHVELERLLKCPGGDIPPISSVSQRILRGFAVRKIPHTLVKKRLTFMNYLSMAPRVV